MANRFFALLAGIDRYANPHQAPHLRGCVADVEGTYALLVNRFGVPKEQILLLTARLDGTEDVATLPTRANIIAGWQQHFAQAGPGDVVFFHYSGHGSQARSADPNEPDGYDETLVPHDSRTAGVYDLADKELATLITSIEERGVQVLVFLDCCHAGSGTRGLTAAAVRSCPADDRVRARNSYVTGTRGWKAVRQEPPSGWLPLGKHLLLAACRDDELSYEYRIPNQNLGVRQWQGVASYFFHKALASASPNISWAQIHDQVLAQVHTLYPTQTPQLEGPSQLTFMGEVGQEVAPYLLVMEVEGNEYIKVDGGLAVGVTPGSRLAVFDAGSDLTGEPLAVGLVEEAVVDHAWAKLDRMVAVEVGARVKVTALGWAESPFGVRTDDALLRAALTAVTDGDRSPFLVAVDSKQEASAEFVVTIDRGVYLLTDNAGRPLWRERPPASADGAKRVADTLVHLAIYRNVQRLRNPAPVGGLQGGIELSAVAFSQSSRSGRPANPKPLLDRGHGATITAGQKLQVTLYNRTDAPLYLALLNLDADFGIRRIYPMHAINQKVEAQGSVVIDQIVPRLSGPLANRAVETLKVIATRMPVSFDVLQLPKLEEGDSQAGVRADTSTPLGQLLNAVRRQGVRDLVVELDDSAAAWTTTQLEVTILAQPAGQLLPAESTKVALAEEGGWTLEKPAGWQARVFLSDLDQSTRGLDGAMLQLPPGLHNPTAVEHFRPVCMGEAVWLHPGSPVVMGIAAAADQLAAITPDQPLRVELTVADEPGLAGIAPIGFDGQAFFLAGRPIDVDQHPTYTGGVRRFACTIDSLPAPVESSGTLNNADPDNPNPVTRDLQRTVRLFFYKLFVGTLPTDSGLRQAELVDGRVIYRPVSAAEVAQSKRVALMLHGFTGDTRWMVEQVWHWVRTQGNYDLCLTYDYETFGTPIRRNADLLASALKGAGFAPGGSVQLDVFAHSVGTQVVRAWVELSDGEQYIDRVFMAGPPNAGTPLAKGRTLLPWLANILLNMAGSVPPALIAHWLLERVSDAGRGLADLAPDSSFYEEINAAWRPPARVPYYVQIGDNSAAYAHWHALAQRLMGVADSGLDVLFAGDNDLLVGVDSARWLEGRWPRLNVQVVGGHHFQYFVSPEGQRVLARWLS
jgi:hypothetical protein